MIWLQYGDNLPHVACVQYLLGFLPGDTDACFGSDTRKAVMEFQKLHNKISSPRLTVDGIVGPLTWKVLNRYSNFRILNFEDGSNPKDPAMSYEIKYFQKHSKYTYYTKKFENVFRYIGGGVLHLYNANIPLLMLRISGHGSSGTQGMSDGLFSQWYWITKKKNMCTAPYKEAEKKSRKYCYIEEDGYELSMKTIEYGLKWIKNIRVGMSPFACVELHGCNIARGQKGRAFVNKLASELKIPVTAGLYKQYAYSPRSVLRFEGAIYSSYPENRKKWAEKASQKQFKIDASLKKREKLLEKQIMRSKN